MATGNNRRDVEVALRVSTLGAEGIRTLEEQIRALAAEGGAAAPEFARLADEVARIGQSAKDLDTFHRLSQDVRELGAAQNVTAETSAVLYGRLQELSAATRAFETAETAAKNALRSAQRDLNDKKDALALLRVETDAAAKKTVEYQASVQSARVAIIAAERGVRDLKEAYVASKAATAGAAEAESALEKQYSAASREAQRSAQALRERNEALAETKGVLAAAGIATDDFATAQNKLVTALNRADAAARQFQEEQARNVAAAKAEALEEERLAGIVLRTRMQMRDAAKAEADGIVRDFERMAAAERAAALAAFEAGRALDQAFSTVGGRSIASVRAEMDKVHAALATIKGNASLSGAEIDRAMALGQSRLKALDRDLRTITSDLTVVERVSGAIHNTFGHMGEAMGVFALIGIAQRLGVAFWDANKQVQGLQLGLSTVYKSSEIAARQIDFLRAVSDKAGVSFSSISESFVKFSASTKAANIPLADTNALFEAVTRAAGTMGLSGDRVTRILDALSQMAGKGVVNMEELRQQLGDSLPGALSLTAKGLGITDAQLYKLVETGGLAARDLFPALTTALKDMHGEVNTLSASWERFKNAMTLTATTMGESGWIDALKGALVSLGLVLGPIALGLSALFDTLFTTVRSVAVAISAIINGDLKNLGPELAKLTNDAIERQAKLSRAYQDLTGISDLTGQSQQRAAGAIGEAGARAQIAAASQQALAVSTKAAGEAATVAEGGFVKLQVAYIELEKVQELNILVADKHVKAMKVQTDAMLQLAALRGNEVEQLTAASTAATENANAAERAAVAKEALVQTITKEKVALEALAIKQEGDLKSREALLKAINERLAKAAAEAEVSRNEAEAAKTTAAARNLATQSYADNSRQVEVLRQNMILLQAVQKETERLELNGKRTREQVAEATRQAAVAEGLYKDALRDSAAAAERNVAATNSHNALKKAGLELAMAEAKAAENKARWLGNEYGVVQAQIKQKEISIQMAKLNIAAIRAEADATDIVINKKIEELIISGKWTDAMATDMALRREAVNIKRTEADAAEKNVTELERELRAMKENQLTRGASADIHNRERAAQESNTASRDVGTESINKQTEALQRLYDKYRTGPGGSGAKGDEKPKTADGFEKNADGSAKGTFTNMLPVDLAFKLADSIKNNRPSGMTVEEARAAFQQAKNAYEDMQAFLKLNPGAASFEYVNSTTQLYTGARAGLEKVLAESGQGGNIGALPPGAKVASTQAAPAGGGYTVNVNLNGALTPIHTTSQADADALARLLKQLGTAKGSAA